MKIYTLCILTGVAFFLAACNEAPTDVKVESKEEPKTSEPAAKEEPAVSEPVAKEEPEVSAPPKAEAGTDKVAGALDGKLFSVNGDAALKKGVEHYVLYHSASW